MLPKQWALTCSGIKPCLYGKRVFCRYRRRFVRCALGTVDPKNFLFTLTYNFLLIIVLGGMGSITGSAIGAIIVTAGLEYLRFFDEPLMLFGMDIPLFRRASVWLFSPYF